MKLGLVTLIRDEKDIVNLFLNHADALFDEVLLLDHRSIDGTGEILKKAAASRKDFQYISVEVNGHYQKEISTLAMRELFERGVDYVFFLDCDEFIVVKDRGSLEHKLTVLSDLLSVGSLRWLNCFTNEIGKSQLNYHSILWKSIEPSPFVKVVVPAVVYYQNNGNMKLTQGNHNICDNTENRLVSKEIGHMLHIPVRSRSQFIYKAFRSSLSHLSRTTKQPGESFQYAEMLKLIKNSEVSPEFVKGCVNLYQKGGKLTPIFKKDLIDGKWLKTSLKSLDVACTRRFSYKIQTREQDHVLERLLAEQILSFGNEDPKGLVFNKSDSVISIPS